MYETITNAGLRQQKFPNGGERSTPNVPDVNQNSELRNVNSTDVRTIFPNVSKSVLRSPKRSQCEFTLMTMCVRLY